MDNNYKEKKLFLTNVYWLVFIEFSLDEFIYLKNRNCLRDKFSRFSRIFTNFTKLNEIHL